MKTVALAVTLGLAALGAAALPSDAHAANDPIYTGFFSNMAMSGYDAVSYHTEGAPVRGSRDFTTEWRGAEWRFSSQDNLDLFLGDPQAYAPAYGGYCAWAMAQGYTAKGDPDVWRIVDGVLYLNFDRSVQELWLEDIPGFIEAANANYPNVVG